MPLQWKHAHKCRQIKPIVCVTALLEDPYATFIQWCTSLDSKKSICYKSLKEDIVCMLLPLTETLRQNYKWKEELGHILH